MRARRNIWPILAYGALAVLALSRRSAGLNPTLLGSRSSARASAEEQTLHQDSETELSSLEQIRRTAQPGRGRRATAPWKIPWRGWKDVLWRTYAGVNDNRLFAVAAGVVFYSLLAMFPAVAAFVSLYGLAADASTIDAHLSLVSGVLPGGAMDILHEQVRKLAASSGARLSLGFVLGLAVALWSANAGMKAVIDALNVAYNEREKRSFVKLNLVSLLFTIIAILSALLALAVVVVAPILLSLIGLSELSSVLVAVLRWPLVVAMTVVGLAAIYRYGPSRREARWEWLSVGSIIAAIAWLVSSALFSWYIANFGAYNATYGSLGAAIGLMMWMWISAIVILLGAEFNAENRAPDRTRLDGRPRKTVGAARRSHGRHGRCRSGLNPFSLEQLRQLFVPTC
jgi:membrane protein